MRTAVLALLLAACTHHRPLREIHELRGDVTIEMAGGELIDATATATPAGTVFRTASGEIVEPRSIARVTDQRRFRGAAEGLGIGAGIGLVGGVVIGLAGGDDPPCQEGCLFRLSASDKAMFAGVGLGLVGGLVGLAVGTVLGSHFVYEGGASPEIVPVGPPGSMGGLTVAF